jgi:nucleotide-binding universal stress UspA family protein
VKGEWAIARPIDLTIDAKYITEMTIIAATDGAMEQDPVVSTAHDLASAYDDRLVVLHVFVQEEFEDHLNEVEEIGEPDTFSISQGEQIAVRVARKTIDMTLKSEDGIEIVGRVGEPAEEILSVADEYNAQYLVIGGRKRTPVGKAMFGSITQSVLLNAGCPVVTVMGEE